MRVMTLPLPFSGLSVVLDNKVVYLMMTGGAFRLFMLGTEFAKFITLLRTHNPGVVMISSPWHDTHAWTYVPGADGQPGIVRYGSEAPGTETSTELTSDDRERLISTWYSHLEWLAFGEKAEKQAAPAAKTETAAPPPPEAASPPAPSSVEEGVARISLPVIK